MADVARRAGVSAQTVSRVSNQTEDVLPGTRDRVLTAMRELGYRPNGAARALKRGEFRTIGVLISGMSSTGDARTLEAIASSAARAGYTVTLIPFSATGVAAAILRLAELDVDAVIAVLDMQLPDELTSALGSDLTTVLIDAGVSFGSVVATDQAGGAKQAVEHLLDLGHRTVWHITGPSESPASAQRQQTWRRVLAEHDREVPEPQPGDWTARSGYEAGLRLGTEADCTAIFAANDQLALGAIRGLRERGRSVPADVSIVGFDDISDAGFFDPPLTTVRQDFAEVGHRAVQAALRELREHRRSPQTSLVPTQLIVRGSTARSTQRSDPR